jgi:hypothetical protein
VTIVCWIASKDRNHQEADGRVTIIKAVRSRTSISLSHIANALDARASKRCWGAAAVIQST